MQAKPPLPEPNDVLYRIKRGVSGYISYLAACEMNASFSEYVLYEPILRILTARGYKVRCELPCPGMEQPARGDKKKLDFEAVGHGLRFALEVKWARSANPDIEGDYAKLVAFRGTDLAAQSFLCIFGRKSHIKPITFPDGRFRERGTAIFAEFGNTIFGCRVFELNIA